MKISIITPSYNQDMFIERTIMSVLSQKGDFEIEYIIMDGGSSDKTLHILKNIETQLENGTLPYFCKKISFIWKSEKDKGQSDAINKGLSIATGDIITYLNSDDTYEPQVLAVVVNAFLDSKKQRCYGKCNIIDKQDNKIRKWITLYKNILGRKYSYSKLLSENFISQMTVFWTREAMQKIGFFNEDEHLCMDYEYWLRLGKLYTPVYIPAYLANFRFYQTSKSGSRFKKQFTDELRIAKKYADGKYRWSLFVHQFNYYKIVFVYKILSFLKK